MACCQLQLTIIVLRIISPQNDKLKCQDHTSNRQILFKVPVIPFSDFPFFLHTCIISISRNSIWLSHIQSWTGDLDVYIDPRPGLWVGVGGITYIPWVASGCGAGAAPLGGVPGPPFHPLHWVDYLGLSDCRGRSPTAGGSAMITVREETDRKFQFPIYHL